MGKSASAIPPQSLELYDQLVATLPQVERKGAAMPYTSCNGHMFSFLTKAGTLALRLPPDERDAFIEKYKARPCEQHGVVLAEYVEVPAALLGRTNALAAYFAMSYAYVAALKPKPTKKPGKKR